MGLNMGINVTRQYDARGAYMDDTPGWNPKGTKEEIEARFAAFMHTRAPFTAQVALTVEINPGFFNFDARPSGYGRDLTEPDWADQLYLAMFAFALQEFDSQCICLSTYYSP